MPDTPTNTEVADPVDLPTRRSWYTRQAVREREDEQTFASSDTPTDTADASDAAITLDSDEAQQTPQQRSSVIKLLANTPALHRLRTSIPQFTAEARARVVSLIHATGYDARWTPTVVRSLIIVVAVIAIAITLPGVWIMVAALAIGACLVTQSSSSTRALLTMLLCATVGVTGVDYLTWRFEVSNWAGWWIAVPLLAAEAFGALHALGLQYTLWPRQEPPLADVDNFAQMPVYIFIPTVNEGTEILRPTIKAVKEACRRYLRVYPDARMKIVICNDGFVANAPDWRETEALARQFRVTYVTRRIPGGAKAGNLENARQKVGATGNALVVIFDADQHPKPEFFLKTIPPFRDPSVGWVQTGQYYRNLQQPVAAWAHDQQALFYRVLCPGKSGQNAAFICGTNVVLRAAALDEIGGLPQDSVTEDFAASIDLHGRWRSLFLSDVLALGLGPMDLPSYLKQQRRWAIGTLGILRTHWRTIFLPWKGSLSFAQRIQYGLACTHYLSGVRDLIYVLAPVAFLATGIPAVRGANLGLFIWHFLPYWLASQTAFWYACRRESGLRGIIIGFGSFPMLIVSLATVILGKRSGFMVTSKQRGSARSWQGFAPYIGLLLLCVVGLVLGFTITGERHDAVMISMLWIAYSAMLLSGFLWLAVSDLRYKEEPLPARNQALTGIWNFTSVPAWAMSLSRRVSMPQVSYSLLNVGILVGAIAFTARDLPTPAATTFTPTPQGAGHVYLGASVRGDTLSTAPLSLESALCEPFTIIGRTQDIQDNFDTSWANRLASEHAQPWVVLEFGQFGPDGKPPINAGLLAIANGLQDANIRRWADEMRAYGKPVYLTILLHVDRNWAISSAVANGGIPQDTARAWLHTQAIFRAEGATNIAWVWSPADPTHDQVYAPPENSIEVVLQSFIRYPGTPWPDVTQVLAEDTARHPGKPLFVEVSAVGSPKDKSTWLKTVMTAVAKDPHVYALLYHEGSPDLHANAADNKQWSLESDPLSVESVKAWRALAQTSASTC